MVTASRRSHLAILGVLVAALWSIYLLPWPVPWFFDQLKPTIVAVLFALFAQRFQVGSWPVVIAFSVSFFIHSVFAFYFGSELQDETDNRFNIAVAIGGALLFSPITLWGPVLMGSLSFSVARRLWRKTPCEPANAR